MFTLMLMGCSGDSEFAAAGSGGAFTISDVSVINGGVWEINRPIRFTFSSAVDFSTVNLNTISISRLNGESALGSFEAVVGDPRTVVFQPACPKREDLSDAGLVPGGVVYWISIPSASTGASSLRSEAGNPLTTNVSLSFTTPTSMQLAEIFRDVRPGHARPLVAPGTGSFLRSGGQIDTYFAIDETGSGTLPDGVVVGNNFYSEPSTQVSLHLRFDQPVSPLAENISPDRLGLEYEIGGEWRSIGCEVVLENNCVGGGATVSITPLGLLPQGRELRAVVTAEFEDMVGETSPSDLRGLVRMTVASVTEADQPVEAGDEFLEEFLDEEFHDLDAVTSFSMAEWGAGGLEASFGFNGTGGPGGEFDLRIPAYTDMVFDTTKALFIGGPNFIPTYSQLVQNGRLHVRDLHVPATASLRIQGPNPATILATGTVLVEGRISADGGNATSVFSLQTPFQPEFGGAGQAGGGSGGTGSYRTNQVTTRGGSGEGAFGADTLGGEGGESGWGRDNTQAGADRRAAGGGGGVLGQDQQIGISAGTGVVLCADQAIYGLDSESGFPGADTAISSQGAHFPWGGRPGPGPFGVYAGVEDDFWGSMIKDVYSPDESIVRGELNGPTAGSGGGAGGDSTFVPPTVSYPPPTLINNHQDKGAGGGGGAGSLTILALGDIVITGTGQITAIGGFGAGGENTAGAWRVGGGSGGGSGGHIVLQTVGRLSLEGTSNQLMAIDARGGEGGEGAGREGGADGSELEFIEDDAKHVGANNGPDNPWEYLDEACFDYLTGTGVVRGAGGDGGPGLVQVHVQNLSSDIIYPSGSSNIGQAYQLGQVVRPVPHGYNSVDGTWRDQLLPIFGRRSVSRSKWIALGEAEVDPVSEDPGQIGFLFGGTAAASGRVLTRDGEITALPPLLTESEPQLDPLDASGRSLLMDAAALLSGEDEIYLRNAQLLRNFELTVGEASYSVAAAAYDEAAQQLRLSVSSAGPSLLGSTGMVELRPRYFEVTTAGVEGSLPDSTGVWIQFDLLAQNPDEPTETSTTGFLGSIADQDLQSLGITRGHVVRYLRYQVSFDLDVLGSGDLVAGVPRPRLEYLRLPFRF